MLGRAEIAAGSEGVGGSESRVVAWNIGCGQRGRSGSLASRGELSDEEKINLRTRFREGLVNDQYFWQRRAWLTEK